MLGVLRIFFNSAGTRPWLVLSCLTVAGFFEFVSLGAMLPLFSLASSGSSTQASGLGRLAMTLLQATGMSAAPSRLIILFLGAIILKNVMVFFALSYAGFAKTEVSTRIRRQLLDALAVASWRYLVGRKGGQIANAISHEAHTASDAYQASAGFVSYLVQAAIYIAAALLISFKLTLAGIAVGALIALFFGKLVDLSRRAGRNMVDATSQLVILVSDALGNIKPIKAMERQGQLFELFASRVDAIRQALRAQVLLHYAVERGSEVILMTLLGVGMYVAAVGQGIDISEVVVLGIIVIKGVESLRHLQSLLRNVGEYESAYWRVQELLTELRSHQEVRTGTKVPTLETGARFESVVLTYDDTPVVRNASLVIAAGEITVLLGPSGAGKTSLVDLLLGLQQPDSGTISIDGTPLQEVSLRDWRRMIGYVPQELTLLHGSIRQNVTLGDPSLSDEDVYEALDLARIGGFVRSLPQGLDTVVGEMGAKLSGGQRQRVALARALVLRPHLLILDEVTSALDPATEVEICGNISELRGRYTIVAITHRPSWQAIADHMIRIEKGRIVEDIRPAEVQGARPAAQP